MKFTDATAKKCYLQVDYNHVRFVQGDMLPDLVVQNAIDLSEYSSSGSWDLMNTTAIKTYFYYPCCAEPYPDITYYVT